ncbi:DUF3000 domain-containing protein [Arcanobacterium phocisimile]|uniref:DUF3000 domain-containing protein n=1 Tax=Arcanobacterium phocisimile TaxID=1302235 RepID=A0ABX7IIC9_9ACTO|nr:DUF3000 domain-containing protein [Arcanobacterium phocisimile]QRV02898.1 DUF3000 domain-containing protein [Arcanobacterium phocisimile]
MGNNQPTPEFINALESLKGHTFHSGFHVVQIPPPTKIAPWAVALQAEINDSPTQDPDFFRGNAKFVVLHDPAGQPAWDGTFRIVMHAQAPIESDLGDDPLLGEVAWSWLPESLAETGARFHSLNGTVTRVFNETFGGLYIDSSRIDLEVRASWTPDSQFLGEHLLAWQRFCMSMSGLPPESTVSHISSLPRRIERV